MALPKLEPVQRGPIPMIMTMDRELLLYLVNEELERNRQERLPATGVEVFITIPSGGDYSGENLEIAEEVKIFFKWKK